VVIVFPPINVTIHLLFKLHNWYKVSKIYKEVLLVCILKFPAFSVFFNILFHFSYFLLASFLDIILLLSASVHVLWDTLRKFISIVWLIDIKLTLTLAVLPTAGSCKRPTNYGECPTCSETFNVIAAFHCHCPVHI